jgi:hypothetical protein
MAKVFIEETTLTAIGDAIRGKTGKTDLIDPALMSTEIANISGGGGSDDVEPVVLTGNCDWSCAGPLAGAFMEAFPTKVSTQAIISAKDMFKNNTAKKIPFDINFTSQMNLSYLFANMPNLTEIPKISDVSPYNFERMFENCQKIQHLPEDLGASWNWSRVDSATSAYAANQSSIFYNCKSLRNIPRALISHGNPIVNPSYSYFMSGFYNCYALDELADLPIPYTATFTSNAFSSTFSGCNRLKRFTFALENGAPKVVSWKSQTIDLTSAVGWATATADSWSEMTGIPMSKLVSSAETYEALKNDPDWWTRTQDLSRYNHDSAVETINSLPDASAYLASAGGTNTIKFRKAVGGATDGGAIENLTEEEIAVAAAKGWTVTLV